MRKELVLFLLAGSLALVYYAEPALACPSPLYCTNFTEPDKIQDCNYLTNQNLNHEEEQEVLCILWEQTYASNGLYQPNSTLVNANVSLPYHEIDDRSLILAGKILLFTLFNYLLISFTKYSAVLKWLSAG